MKFASRVAREPPPVQTIEAPSAVEPRSRLRLSPLFDEAFYVAGLAARGLSLNGVDAALHYEREGEAAGVAPHLLFDPVFYDERNPDVAAAGVNRLHHYIENGHLEGRDPHPLIDLKLIRAQLAPDFAGDPLIAYLQSRGGAIQPHRLVDPGFVAHAQRRAAPQDERPALVFLLTSDPDRVNPSADFDGYGYRRLYPESAAYHPLVHFVRFGEAQGLRSPTDRGPLARAADDIEAAARLDPDILKPFSDWSTVPVTAGYDLGRREFRLYRRLLRDAGRLSYTHAILVPWLKRGGADRAALHLARALLENDPAGRVLMVCTQDDAVEALDWAEPSQRLRVVRIAGELDGAHDTAVAFCNFLRFAGCRHVFVINSLFGWDLIERYGRALRPAMRLYGFVFCQDYDDRGRRAGYAWTRLDRALDQLDAMVSDNGRTISEFAADHGFDAQDLRRFFLLPLPADDRLYDAAAQAAVNLRQGERRRHRVFWANRFAAQKGLDVAAEVARRLLGADVVAFGGPDAPTPLVSGGAFADFADLPLHEASLFLHTALWEGLPNVLLEAGAAGLPIVARDVGGVGELVDETTGWLVPTHAGGDAFVAALRDALDRPEEAIARAGRMRARIAERHSWAAFAEAVRRLLTFDGAAHG